MVYSYIESKTFAQYLLYHDEIFRYYRNEDLRNARYIEPSGDISQLQGNFS